MQKTIVYGGRAVLGLYTLFLLWLILFKFSFDIPLVILEHQARSLNLIPFADLSESLRQMIDNFMVFIPFGLLLGVNFKQISLWQKLAFIFSFSLVAEITQFVLAIGATDITDVIANTLGGLLGLALYGLGSKYVGKKKLDICIIAIGAVLLTAFILLRVLVFKVRY